MRSNVTTPFLLSLLLLNTPAFAAGGATSVAAGDAHTCAVVNGGVQCWGRNDKGQLGNNGTVRSLSPVQTMAGNSAATMVAAGSQHVCAAVDGGVRCWGDNQFGQLGNNSTTASAVPVQTIAAGSGVTAIGTGNSHSCALVNGGVQCWGMNLNGQLGNNSTAQSLVPVQAIAAGSQVSSIAAGGRHTCAVANGGVRCWGDNQSGQLGNGATAASLVPVQAIAAGGGATAVSAGLRHTCAVVNGGAQCWGENSQNELGNNSTARSLVPTQTIAAGSGATAITAGGDATSCAAVNGGLQCWGNNIGGMVGINSNAFTIPAPAQTVPSASGVTAVSSGFFHTCAVVAGGVSCWGTNPDGQLGTGNTTAAPVPTGVTLLAGDAPDYTGAWYNAAESGWGLSVVRGASGALGIVMYNYNQGRSPTWYFMSGGSLNGSTYTAPVTRYTGPAFSEPFNAAPVVISNAGTVTIQFTSATTATLNYTIDGIAVSKSIVRLSF